MRTLKVKIKNYSRFTCLIISKRENKIALVYNNSIKEYHPSLLCENLELVIYILIAETF